MPDTPTPEERVWRVRECDLDRLAEATTTWPAEGTIEVHLVPAPELPERGEERVCPSCGSDEPSWDRAIGGNARSARIAHEFNMVPCPDDFHNPASASTEGDLLRDVSGCRCCGDGCDCGCAEVCPRCNPEERGERWTIYVCPKCGASNVEDKTDPDGWCYRCKGDTGVRPVEVCPVSELRAVEERAEKFDREATTWKGRLNAEQARLRAQIKKERQSSTEDTER